MDAMSTRLRVTRKLVGANKRKLVVLKQALYCRRSRMLHELSMIFPIENCGEYRTIRGVPLPPLTILEKVDFKDEFIGIGLGYVAHVVAMVAKYLCIPLPYEDLKTSSTSSQLRDWFLFGDVTAHHPGEYPLFYKSADKARFKDTIHKLASTTRQFLISRGHRSMSDSNILQNVESLLYRETLEIEDFTSADNHRRNSLRI